MLHVKFTDLFVLKQGQCLTLL